MSIQAMKQALEALEGLAHDSTGKTGTQMMRDMDNAITALRAAIAEAEKVEPDNFRERLMENARLSNELGYFFPQPAIPVGWQLVPVEPTKEMLDAVSKGLADGYLQYRKIRCARDYKIMLAAVPKPENSHE